MNAPSVLRDVFGESPSRREILAVLAFGLGAALWVVLELRADRGGVTWWRTAIAALVIADIAAGCVANFTRSTNDFYATRPRNRWVFIAVHGHVLVVAAALGADLVLAVAVWAYTVVAASVVNLLAAAPAQRFVAGLLLAAALVWIPLVGGAGSPLMVVYCLFVLKVVYAFAVDHHAGGRASISSDAEGGHPTEPEPVRELGSSDRAAFVSVMAGAFARDPWIEATLGAAGAPSSSDRLTAFASFMFDHNRLLGGRPLGLFDGDRLVACALVEPPASRWRTSLGMLASLVRFAPVAVRLGARRTGLLNSYLLRTREVAPRAPHHYLAMIGVAPSAQRRGWGKRLLHEVVARAARVPSSVGLALDTENPENVPMYLRLGFTVTATLALAGARATVMFRPHRTVCGEHLYSWRLDARDGSTPAASPRQSSGNAAPWSPTA